MNEHIVDRFREEHYFLSNFYQCSVQYNWLTFPTVEAAFQAAKTFDEERSSY